MRKFHFEFETLLNLKKTHLRLAEQRLQQENAGLRTAQEQARQLQLQLERTAQSMVDAVELRSPETEEFVSQRRFADSLQASLRAVELEVDSRTQKRNEVRDEQRALKKDIEALNTLRVEKWTLHNGETKREQQRHLDEHILRNEQGISRLGGGQP